MNLFPLIYVLRGFCVCNVLKVRFDENPCAALISEKIFYLGIENEVLYKLKLRFMLIWLKKIKRM
jgi:hypothetical protein